MKVLIIEDDQFLQKMYQKKFEVAGFEVSSASDGEDGLVKIKAIKPDLVLMDVMLPKLNGLDALVSAKQDPEIKDIPILIITNLSSASDAEDAMQKGAVGYMIKSDFTPSQVIEKAQEVLSRKS